MHERQGPESCNTNNMLKLTEGLFRMHPKVEYADFMNVPCIIISFLPSILNMGICIFHTCLPLALSCLFGTGKAMWCCVGTGMENHGKYGQFIYTHDTADNALYVNLLYLLN